MGERFSADPAEQARIAASQKLWTVILLGVLLSSLVVSAVLAGLSLRTHRVIAGLNLFVLAAFVALVSLSALWGT
jgi:ABC-type uncharacterized transport system permease subunit